MEVEHSSLQLDHRVRRGSNSITYIKEMSAVYACSILLIGG